MMDGEENFSDKERHGKAQQGADPWREGHGWGQHHHSNNHNRGHSIDKPPKSMLISSHRLVSNHLDPACQMVQGDSGWVEGDHFPLSVQINDIPNISLMAL